MEEKKNIVLFSSPEECCGCFACKAICPQKAISKELDVQGFYYPQINYEKCVGCKSCLKVCPLKKE